jgi:hypothetical protein
MGTVFDHSSNRVVAVAAGRPARAGCGHGTLKVGWAMLLLLVLPLGRSAGSGSASRQRSGER